MGMVLLTEFGEHMFGEVIGILQAEVCCWW